VLRKVLLGVSMVRGTVRTNVVDSLWEVHLQVLQSYGGALEFSGSSPGRDWLYMYLVIRGGVLLFLTAK